MAARAKLALDAADGFFHVVRNGSGYGDTLTWSDRIKPALDLPLVEVQMDVDMARFGRMFVELMTGPTPGAKQ